MFNRRKKPEILKRTDHRLDMSPMGRNLFISRDKQAQSRSARRIQLGMKIVIWLVVAAVAVGVCLFAGMYLLPFFHAEFQIGGNESETSSSDIVVSSLPIYDDLGLSVYGDDVNLFVINEDSPADADFQPELSTVGEIQVDARIVEAVEMMMNDAKEAGLSLVFTEGYVSYEEQEKRFQETVETLMEDQGLTTVMARTEAKTTAPMGGQSDFQTGLCIRVDGDPETFESSRTYTWLKNNMGKYGFTFRYPQYSEDYTGCKPNPTVIRYAGSANVAAMQQRSMCLEEYISYLNRQ